MNEAPENALERLREQDARARRAALDVTRSFIVQAPAGSGKTELLIQRYLALLAHAQAPEEIVAITFTRKATAEMRWRVLEALSRADEDDSPARDHERVTRELARAARARDRTAGWGLAENPNRLRIQTIDSLCHWLTRGIPLASGFGAQPETLEEAEELYREAAMRTLAALDSSGPWARHVATVLRHLDNHVERARDLIAAMLAVRDQWLRSVVRAGGGERSALEQALANAVGDALAALSALAPPQVRERLPAFAAYAAAQLEAAGIESPIRACRGMSALPGAGLEDLERWRGLAELLLTGEGALRRRVNAQQGFLPASGASGAERRRREDAKKQFEAFLEGVAPHRLFLEQLHFTRSLPPTAYSDAQWEVVEALVALLPVAVGELKVLFQERGQVDFTEVAQRAVQALGGPESPTDLALALDYRIRHLLVDEFQDTSWSQYDLLAGLTAGWQPGDGRTLFVVGDPMQSIYRFRKAEVGLYLRAWHEGIGTVALERLVLAVNFRSTRAVVGWLNEVFSRVLPDAEDLASGAVPFVPSVADERAAEGVAPRLHALAVDDRAAEARIVADLVREALAEQPDGTIAVLVRSRGHLAAIVPELKRFGVRFQAIEIEELGHRPIVQDLTALARALAHPADRVAWLSVLRAPWCGLTLADLEALAGHDHDAALPVLVRDPVVLARLSADGRARLERVGAVLDAALAARRRDSFARRVEGTWLALGGPACAREAVELEDARAFFKLLESLEEGGDLASFETLAERVARLYARPDTSAEAGRVQLMTIHKAKGLQFDTVILPGLGYAPRRDEPKLLAWLERPREGAAPDLLLAPIREAAAESDPIYDYLAALEAAREAHESARLLYVAATRTRSRLHLLGHVESLPGRAVKPRCGSLLARLWPALAEEFERALGQARAAPPAARQPAPHAIRRFPSGWRPPAPPQAVAWRAPVALVRSADPHAEVEFSWASETAKRIGTVVHRYLQVIAQEGLAKWSGERIAALRAVFERELRRIGVPEAETGRAAARVQEALGACLAEPRGRWVLGEHAQAASELRLTGVLGGEIVSVAMDRTFVDEGGTRWIVDYKVGPHEGGDVEAFLDRERERYTPQLERYGALMRQMESRPIRLALYFPLLHGWREWSYESKGR